MKSVFINSVGSVSSQKTFDNTNFLEDVVHYDDTVLSVIAPDYKAHIPPAAARRMAKGIKMSTVSSKMAIQEAGIAEDKIDAIIVGTGLGCIGDSDRFVGDIIKNNEQYLTPTRFIQSSHNTVSGQIALNIGCKGHNFTYVHSSVSFESALLDAKMQLENNEVAHILVGGVDELTGHHIDSHRLIKHIKEQPVTTMSLLTSGTEGAIFSEGAHFFALSNQKQDSSYAELMDIRTFNTLPQSQVSEKVKTFLSANDMSTNDIDILILGYNGDVKFDGYYDQLANGVFKNTSQVYYKHLSGEFDTASGFGFWLGNKILKHQNIPVAVQLNQITAEQPKNILLYNQYRGENHSLTLLRKC